MMRQNGVPVALSLGGNLGDVAATFQQAAATLARQGLADVRMSSLYRNPPVGCAPGTPDFCNAALTGVWSGTVEALHECCRQCEVEAGRPRVHESYASRTLDLDIVFFGGETIVTPELHIPHREAANRLFVLVPLAEIAGDWPFPGRGATVREVLTPLTGSGDYRDFLRGRV